MATNVYKKTEHDHLSLEELALYHLIDDYRFELGLASIPLSKGLTATAGRHVIDTRENIWAEGVQLPSGANLHSWSDAPYYSDHRDPKVMWEAPARLGTGYDDSGYEISAAGQADIAAALQGWKGSPGHNAVLAGLGGWGDHDFNAIGIGVETSNGPGPYGHGEIYHVWFGRDPDPGGPPRIIGTNRADDVKGTGFADDIRVRDGDDEVNGRKGADRLSGGAGEDILRGGKGKDRLFGGEGPDVLKGGNGDDKLTGGAGSDILKGGDGDDVFIFANTSQSVPGAFRDRLRDFEANEDRINLRGIDADVTRSGNQAFEWIGRTGFSGEAGELRYKGGILAADVDGDGRVDFQLGLDGGPDLAADDLIL